ncbi:choline-sulfatase [Klebsiella pneumoniae]|nr:choline-sulfatase [Klebsiella pneumoniae]
MKEPNKIDGNRRDLLKGLGIAAVGDAANLLI